LRRPRALDNAERDFFSEYCWFLKNPKLGSSVEHVYRLARLYDRFEANDRT